MAINHDALAGASESGFWFAPPWPPQLLSSSLDKDVTQGDWVIERLASEIHAYKEVLLHDTDMKSLQVLFAKLGVERDGPLLMPALLDPEGKPYSYWS